MSIDDIIKNLITRLNLGVIVENPLRVYGGLLNRLYKVKTTSGIYAIKHLNPNLIAKDNAKDNIILTEKIANTAKEKGVNCIPAIAFNNESLQEINNNYFLIFEWFNGITISNTMITIEHVKKVASMLSQIHNINFGELKNLCNKPNKLFEVNWNYYASRIENTQIKELLVHNKDKLYEIDRKSTQASKDINNEIVVSHRDLDILNILWNKNEEPFAIDWELAGLVNPCEEAIETAWNWSGGHECFDINKFNCFLDTYKSCGGNLKDINKAIYSCFKNNSDWLEYNLKRSCGINCSDNEEMEIGEKEALRVIKKVLKFYEIMDKEF